MLPEERRGESSNPAHASIIHDRSIWSRRYARQETVGPLKGIGALGRLRAGRGRLLSIGVVLLVVGLLRLLQTDVGDDVFYGDLVLVPYLIVLVVCGVVIALARSAASRRPTCTAAELSDDEQRAIEASERASRAAGSGRR